MNFQTRSAQNAEVTQETKREGHSQYLWKRLHRVRAVYHTMSCNVSCHVSSVTSSRQAAAATAATAAAAAAADTRGVRACLRDCGAPPRRSSWHYN
ncbi:hypothetical protein JYU34_006996 [Plutella xylostella]|uniref:Uncharacterized protein n=1 Tax=Plutella xylostella TaxID=51655 RepID=A0ABQ7QTC4_PLUXY|nr:hypothetical protein JYU34_006996 [Plutella xylostella]